MTRVVGLEIGTTAVRAVQLRSRRRRVVVERVGEVGLRPGAVVAGEVADPAAVGAALRQLWRETRFSTRDVVLGVANARAVVRATDLPNLPEGELRSSLPFQVGELIPWPVDNAQLDFHVVGPVEGGPGDARPRVLLVAAQRDMLRAALAAADEAALRVKRIDLVPFALIDALAPHVAGRSEAIVSMDAGVTNVVVHEGGSPRFARTTPSGAELVTRESALVGVPVPPAAVGRWTGDAFGPASSPPAVGDVVDSLDYHLAQPGTAPLDRIVVIGAGEAASELRGHLAEHGGAVVEEGDVLGGVARARPTRAFDAMAAAADRYAPALGLALGELRPTGGRRIDLLPRDVVLRRLQRRQLIAAAVVLVAMAVGLVGVSLDRRSRVADARAEAARVDRRVAVLESKVARYGAVAAEQAAVAQRRALLGTSLAGDVAWTRLFREVSAALPGDVWLMSLSLAGAGGTTAGSVTLTAKGRDQAAPARFLRGMEGVPAVAGVWVSSSSRDGSAGGRGFVTFTATATLTPAAGSGRIAQFAGGT